MTTCSARKCESVPGQTLHGQEVNESIWSRKSSSVHLTPTDEVHTHFQEILAQQP